MTRAGREVYESIRFKWRQVFTRRFWFWFPRPGYCRCCSAWCWLTNERPAYSAFDGCFICEECATSNDEETRQAWSDYYSGCL